ncbi:MAG: YesL family protein [Firmicutes bacterium]|nr:YesL family protein [Bacillota bacterium]
MLGRFFHSFYYGKAGKGDYTPENLPANRVQLFFEALRVRWSSLVKLNMLYIVFLLPALLWTFLNYGAWQNVEAMAQTSEMLRGEADAQTLSIVGTWLLLLWPCIAITGPATAGVSYITRNWARDQHSFFLSDFKEAFAGNWKQALPMSCITGFVPLLVYVCYSFYGEQAEQSLLFIIPQVLVVVLGVVWLLSQQLAYMLMVTYKLTFGQVLRNALLLAVGKLPLSVGIRLLSLAFPLLCLLASILIPSVFGFALLALVLYYLLFGFAFSRFLYASYANAVCEKYINTGIEGAEVGMGLRQVTEDDYEIDPTLPQPGSGDEDDENTELK